MPVYDRSTRSSGDPPVWSPDQPSRLYEEAPFHDRHSYESPVEDRYDDESPVADRHRDELPEHDPYQDYPSRPPADWTPAHAAGPPPAWTPAEGGGAPARRRNRRLPLIGGFVAVAVTSAGLTAGVTAAVGGDSGSDSGAASAPVGGGQATENALHGTYVVSDGKGGYTTQLTQTGTASAVSATSITVQSSDGYSKTYVISSSTTVGGGTIANVAKGHTVRIVATSAKQKVTATSITDTSR